MWDRWRDLTRFRLACEMALASYKNYVNGFPVSAEAPLVIHDPSGESGFKCNLVDFKQVLNDDGALYRVLYPSYVALVEDLARELIEKAVDNKGLPRSCFPSLDGAGDIADAAERYVTTTPVEVWGAALLKAGDRDWTGINGGKRAVVETVTVRNLCAHGLPAFNAKAVNRIQAAASRKIGLRAGDPVALDKKKFAAYTSALRTFARILADGVTNLPDQRSPGAAT